MQVAKVVQSLLEGLETGEGGGVVVLKVRTKLIINREKCDIQ